MEISANNLSVLFTGFDTIFQKGFEMAPSYYEKICSVVPSSTSQTLYPWLGRTTGFREWVGDRVLQALEAHAYTIVNKTFEDTVGIERERIEDDQYGVYTPVIEQLGWDARTHPDQLIFGMMKAAAQYANTAVSNTQTIQIGKLTIPAPAAYDGLSLYNTGHPTNPAGQLGALLPQWQASTAYLLNQEILDSNGNTQVVTTAGTSGSSAPSWSTTLNATTTDSGVTWTLRSKGGGLVASNVNTSG